MSDIGLKMVEIMHMVIEAVMQAHILGYEGENIHWRKDEAFHRFRCCSCGARAEQGITNNDEPIPELAFCELHNLIPKTAAEAARYVKERQEYDERRSQNQLGA